MLGLPTASPLVVMAAELKNALKKKLRKGWLVTSGI